MSLRMGLFVGLVDPGIWLGRNKNIPRQSTIYELLIEVFSAVKFFDVFHMNLKPNSVFVNQFTSFFQAS